MDYIRKLGSAFAAADQYSTPAPDIVVDEDVRKQVKSILSPRYRKKRHPYGQFSGSDRSEHERVHGRDPNRRVRIMLPTSHVERRQRRVHSVSRQRRSVGVTLSDVIQIYDQACRSRNCRPLEPVVDLLRRGAQGDETAARTLSLPGIKQISRAQVEGLCQIIANNTWLREIDFAGIGLDDSAVHLLCQHILLRRCCSKLNLADNYFGPPGMGGLCDILQRSMLLTYLNLSGIHFNRRMGQLLQMSLPRSKLHTLIMHRCGLHDVSTLTLVASGCASCSSLLNISFKSNNIPSAGGRWVALPLKAQAIECLDLRCNSLEDRGVLEIANALDSGGSVQKLVLYDNNITVRGAIRLIKSIPRESTLESLDLSMNPVGHAEMVSALKHALVGNTTLKNLFLWNVDMRDDGAIALAELLAENRTLQRIELRQNTIGMAGLLALSHTVRCNPTIFKVLLDLPFHRTSEEEETLQTVYTQIQRTCAENLARHVPLSDSQERRMERILLRQRSAADGGGGAEGDVVVIQPGVEDEEVLRCCRRRDAAAAAGVVEARDAGAGENWKGGEEKDEEEEEDEEGEAEEVKEEGEGEEEKAESAEGEGASEGQQDIGASSRKTKTVSWADESPTEKNGRGHESVQQTEGRDSPAKGEVERNEEVDRMSLPKQVRPDDGEDTSNGDREQPAQPQKNVGPCLQPQQQQDQRHEEDDSTAVDQERARELEREQGTASNETSGGADANDDSARPVLVFPAHRADGHASTARNRNNSNNNDNNTEDDDGDPEADNSVQRGANGKRATSPLRFSHAGDATQKTNDEDNNTISAA